MPTTTCNWYPLVCTCGSELGFPKKGREVMSTTTDKGWSTDWPKVNDTFYWMRWRDGRYRDLPVHVAGIYVMCLFDHSYLQRGNIEGEVEFLGPISSADFEQLAALRKIGVEARDVLALLVPYGKIHTVEGVRYPDGTHSEAVDRGERVLNELRRIVGKEWEDESDAALREALGDK